MLNKQQISEEVTKALIGIMRGPLEHPQDRLSAAHTLLTTHSYDVAFCESVVAELRVWLADGSLSQYRLDVARLLLRAINE